MNRRGFLGMLVASAFIAAACGTGSSPKPSLDLPTSIGEGEGELKLVIWAGYAERGAALSTGTSQVPQRTGGKRHLH